MKYKCPSKAYGFECRCKEECPAGSGIRIPLVLYRRVFTPVARSGYKWKILYNQRMAVERVNSRLDVSFGFEHHSICGQKKMTNPIPIEIKKELIIPMEVLTTEQRGLPVMSL